MRKGTVVERVRPGIRRLSNYVVKELGSEIIQMDKNENPYDLPTDLKREVMDIVMQRSWSRYPPIVAQELYRNVAEYTGWTPDGVVAGNGSDELIMTVMTTFMERGKKLVIPSPSFPMFKYMGTLAGAEIVEVPLNDDYSYDCDALEHAFIDGGGDMLIICMPNNPTGSMFPVERIPRIAEQTNAPIIIDEAYFEFSKVTALDYIREYNNIIVFRTFSKAFSLAGLRLGYGLMSPELALEIGKVKLPFNIDVFSIIASGVLLKNHTRLEPTIRLILEERDKLSTRMQALPEVTVYPTASNFILFKTPYDSGKLCEGIIKGDVLVRDLSGHSALKNTLRVTVSRPEDNELFFASLTNALDELRTTG